ncbi:MAG: hypothetical protein P4N59_11500 [Negativicutes bacterium]|nr:hypothetical protein [Negativicutes bacterium]
MGVASFQQGSFLGGEWSLSYQGRIDDPRYTTAMNLCLNAFPTEQGSWTRRSGTSFAATTRYGQPGRVFAFPFFDTSPYTVEVTPGHMRFFEGQNLLLNAPVGVSAISSGTPAIVTLSAPVAWMTGDEVQFQFAGAPATANSLLLNRTLVVDMIDTTHFYIQDNVTNAPVSGASFSIPAYTTVAQVVDIVVPYLAADIPNLQFIQTGESAFIVCKGYPPYYLQVTSGPTSTYPFYTFSFSIAVFTDGPYLDPVEGQPFSVSAESGISTVTLTTPQGINNNTGFQPTDVGRMIRILQEPLGWVSGTNYLVGNQVSYLNQFGYVGGSAVYYQCTTTLSSTHSSISPNINPAYWVLITTPFPSWIVGVITAVNSATQATILIQGSQVTGQLNYSTLQIGLFTQTPDITGNPVYPSCGTYHEGRLWLGGAIPNRFDASMSNDVLSFQASSLLGNTISDNNAMGYVLNSSDANQLVWMLSDTQGVVCGSLSGEWLIQASSTSEPLTPTSIQAHRVTKYGCAPSVPIKTGISLLFIQKLRQRVLEFLEDVFTGKYMAPNLSEAAQHLCTPGIQELAYQEELVPTVWMRRTDGELIGMSYRRVSTFLSEAPKFVGWHHHTFGSGRKVISISNGPSPNGLLDNLSLVTQDPVTGVCNVEFLMNNFPEGDDATAAWFLDEAVAPPTATFGSTTITFAGLNHLEGKTVSTHICALDCGDYLVTNGQIVVPFGADAAGICQLSYIQSVASSGLNFQQSSVTETSLGIVFPAVVGFNYVSAGQIVRPQLPAQIASPVGAGLGKTRRIQSAGFQLVDTQSLSAGTNANNLHPMTFLTPSLKPIAINQLVSGIYWTPISDDYSYDAMLYWQSNRSYPATVAGVNLFLQAQERA